MTSSFAPYVIINTAPQKKTSTHHDGNITGNQQISSHNDKTTPHSDKTTPHNDKTSPHNNIATVHYDKLQNIKTILEDQRSKNYIRKLWLSILIRCTPNFDTQQSP